MDSVAQVHFDPTAGFDKLCRNMCNKRGALRSPDLEDDLVLELDLPGQLSYSMDRQHSSFVTAVEPGLSH